VGQVARMGRRETCIGYLWERQRERALGRTRFRWVDNIKIDLIDIGWGDVQWISLAQDRDK
jgi:hypothetical protein